MPWATIVASAIAAVWHGYLTAHIVKLLLAHPTMIHGPLVLRVVGLLAVTVVPLVLGVFLVFAGMALLKRATLARLAVVVVGPLVAALCLYRVVKSFPVLLGAWRTMRIAMHHAPQEIHTVVWLTCGTGLFLLIAVTLIVVVVGLMSKDVREVML